MNDPPKILHVEAGPTYGGSLRALEVYLSNTVPGEFLRDVVLYHAVPGYQALAPLVSNVHVLSTGGSGETPAQRAPKSGRVRVWLKKLLSASLVEAAVGWSDLLRSLPCAVRLYSFMRAGHYDLIHVNNSFTFQPATIIAAKLARIPIVAHARNPQPRCLPSKLLMRMVRQVVTVSRFHEQELRSWGLSVPVTTCYDCVKAPVADLARAQQVRASLLREGSLLIGSVGRLDEQKGYEDLVRAARTVVKARPEVRFVIAGDGPLRQVLSQLIESLELNSHFELCGFRTDIPEFVSALDIFVCSSHWEGLPLAIVEAMLLKKPVIATNVCGNSEVVRPGCTGKLVPVADPKALAAAIIDTIRRLPSTRLETEQAYEMALEQFDPTLTAGRFDEILRRALKPKHAATDQAAIASAGK